MLEIATQNLPAPLIAALKHAASLHNPEFYRRQAQRYSTFATPRFVCRFDDTNPLTLRLPDLPGAAGGSSTAWRARCLVFAYLAFRTSGLRVESLDHGGGGGPFGDRRDSHRHRALRQPPIHRRKSSGSWIY